MIESLLVYALSVYALFHVVGRSDLLAKPRAWALRVLPAKVTYPISCAFCFTIWTSLFLAALMWVLTGFVFASHLSLLAAPVINLLVDLLVKALERAANGSPTAYPTSQTVTSTTSSHTFSISPSACPPPTPLS